MSLRFCIASLSLFWLGCVRNLPQPETTVLALETTPDVTAEDVVALGTADFERPRHFSLHWIQDESNEHVGVLVSSAALGVRSVLARVECPSTNIIRSAPWTSELETWWDLFARAPTLTDEEVIVQDEPTTAGFTATWRRTSTVTHDTEIIYRGAEVFPGPRCYAWLHAATSGEQLGQLIAREYQLALEASFSIDRIRTRSPSESHGIPTPVWRDEHTSLARYIHQHMQWPSSSWLLVAGDTRHELGFGPAFEQTPARMRVGSLTKPFTGLLLARAIERGLATWSSSLREVLGVPVPTLEGVHEPIGFFGATLAESVCACSGFASLRTQTLLEPVPSTVWFSAFLEQRPQWAPGMRFSYSNEMVALGGYAATELLNNSPQTNLDDLALLYPTAMRQEIFAPLNMPRASFSPEEGDAPGHARNIRGELIRDQTSWYAALDHRLPSGGLIINAAELETFIRFELGRDGRPLLSQSAFEGHRLPQVRGDLGSFYGHGWGISNRLGHISYQHVGGTAGTSAILLIIPAMEFGLAILVNEGGQGEALLLAAEALLRVSVHRDRELAPLEALQESRERRFEDWTVIASTAEPGTESRSRVRRYSSPNTGDIIFYRTARNLIADFGHWQSRVDRHPEDHGAVTLVDPPAAGLQFRYEGCPVDAVWDTCWPQVMSTQDGVLTYTFEDAGP